jgi:hypothetical protein
MGSQVHAICECGVHKSILIGGGKLSFTYLEYFPCLCVDCQDVVQSDLKENSWIIKGIDVLDFSTKKKNEQLIENSLKNKKISCPECKGQNVIPYNDERLIGKKGDDKVINWGNNYLDNGTYYCPKCENMTLKFLHSLFMWD